MSALARCGLARAARELCIRPSLSLPLRRPLPSSTRALARRLPYPLRYSTIEPSVAAYHNTYNPSGAMDSAHEVQESGSAQNGGMEAEADLSPRPPPQLKPGDSFGSDFYGELNGISIGSQDSSETLPSDADATNASADTDVEGGKTEAEEETEPPIVLSFKRKPLPAPVPPNEIPKEIPPSFWSHKLYTGPNGENVTVEYCSTFEESEKTAQKFLNEPVLGLDMEWYPYPSDEIKLNASVLQLACQDKIAIFHLARHEGETAEEIVPPTLKHIVESPDILKAGVHIHSADGTKLRQYLKLNPKGLFEVSHLYNLLANRRNASGYVLKTSKRLSDQVQEKLGLPLLKDSVRTSNWHRPLNQSQIDYAAADAYAGFMLYHIMNEERKLRKPKPPRPEFAELGLPIIGIPEEKDADEDDPSDDSKPNTEARSRKNNVIDPDGELQGSSLVLYDALTIKRTDIAMEKGVKPFQIATNKVLQRVALARPQTMEELKQVRGLGDQGIRNFGDSILATIKAFPTTEVSSEAGEKIPEDVIIDDPIVTDKKRKQRPAKNSSDLDESSMRLYNALSDKRKEIAAERNIPYWQLYRIATNDVLREIARQHPTSLDKLRMTKGVGAYRANQFGQAWLSVIREFDKADGLEQKLPEYGAPSTQAFEEQTAEDDISDDETLYISADELPPGAENYLAGERIVFTGMLDILGRTGAQELATKCGAEVALKADIDTTLIVTGRNVSESKLEAIHQHKLPTMTEQDFLALIHRKSAAVTQSQPPHNPTSLDSNNITTNPFTFAQPPTTAEVPPDDRPFLNALIALRTQLSRASALAPETIISDADLRAIALARPARRSDLLRLPCARQLDAMARQHGKNVDGFLKRYSSAGRSRSAGAVMEASSGERVTDEESSEKESESVFERRTAPPTIAGRTTEAAIAGWAEGSGASRKRKF